MAKQGLFLTGEMCDADQHHCSRLEPHDGAGLGRAAIISTVTPQTSQDIPGHSQHDEHNLPAFEAEEPEGKLLPQAQTEPVFKGMFFLSNPQKRL